MSVQEMEARYHELREKFVTGAISREIFETQVARLRYQDARGRHWAIGLQTGRWYVHEGGRWRQDDNPLPPAEPKCAHCGQLLPPGREFCALCGTRVPLAPPPPVEKVSVAPEVSPLTPEEPPRPRSWLRIGGGLALGLAVLACLFILVDGVVLYTRATGATWAFLGFNAPAPPSPSPLPTAVPVATPTASPTVPSPTQPAPTQTATPTPSPPAGLVVQSPYENAALGFRLRYPLGWVYAEQADHVVFAARQAELEMRNLTDGRFLAVGRGTGLDDVDTPQAALGKVVDGLEGEDILIGKVQTDTLDNEAAAGVLVSFIPTGENLTLKMYLLVAFHAGQPYVVMAAAPVADWPQVWPAYQEMLDSFDFIEKPATPTRTRTPSTPVAATTPTRTVRPPATPTATLVPGLQFQQDGPVEAGPGDCKGTALVWGYVHDVDGRVMDGVYLFVWFEGGDWGPAPQVTRTDEKGVYRLQLLTGQKGTYRVMVVKGWQDRTPLSPPSAPIEVDNYCAHSDFKVNWRRVTPKTPTPTRLPPATVVSDYPFMGDGEVKLSEPNCGKPFKIQGRIAGLNEWAGRITVKVRDPDGTVYDFAEAVRSDGSYLLPTVQARGGEFLIWLEEKGSGKRLSDHVQFSGVDPCEGTIFEINWKRRK